MSQNSLKTLPCGLILCGLEHLDISSNDFTSEDYLGESDFERNQVPPWNIYINSLVHIAAKVVLKHKFFYAPNIIPKTLVEFLDNFNMCICGKPVFSENYYIIKQFDLKYSSLSRDVTFNFNTNLSVGVECFYCSPKCFVSLVGGRSN